MKYGVDIDTISVDSLDRLNLQYTFSSLSQYLNTIHHVTNPLTGQPYNYAQLTQQFGDNTAYSRTTPVNWFVEDHFQVKPNLTLSYGLRWEYRFFPALNSNAPLLISRRIPSDTSDFAPRFGFAWQAGAKTVVRGGYGLFYDTLNLRLISLVDRSNGTQVQTYTVNGTTNGVPTPGAPLYPNAFPGPATNFAVKTSVYGFAPDFRTQYAHQANVQVERELATNLSLTVGAQWYGGHAEPLLIDTNLGAPVGTLPDGRSVFSNANRPNRAFNQIFNIESVGNSVYYGGFIGLNKRFSESLQFTASYTLGWALNDNDSVGDNGSNVTDSTDIRRDWGFSSSDQRHRFVLQGVWQPTMQRHGLGSAILNGWLFAPNVTLTSGFPFSSTYGSDLNGDRVNNDRPLYTARNTFVGPGFEEVNLRISRTFPLYKERFHLQLIGEAENLFNHTNAACNAGGCGGAVITQYNSPNFGQPTVAFNSRQIQVGGRIIF